MKQWLIIFFTSLCMGSLFLSACNDRDKKYKTPVAYDLNDPEKFIMPSSLFEISGICFNQGNPDTFFAVQDEEGKLFRKVFEKKEAYHEKFGKKGDYEDLAVIKGKIFVLRSDGTVFSFPNTTSNQPDTVGVEELRGLVPKGEYEGMYGEEATGKLYILCKNCDADDNNKQVSGYIINVNDSVNFSSNFSINVTSIQSSTKKSIPRFRPSALAKNPVSGEWFILSGSDKLLVISDSSWNIKEVYPLNGNTFNQAEGITFDRDGNLYISNEGGETTNGNVLKFMMKKN